MAEKYGTMPKKFTKEWWSWYWMYHKGITIGVIFVLILLIITIVDLVTKDKYDLTLTYASKYYCEQEENIEKILSPLCEDFDENGEKALFFIQYVADLDTNDAEYLQATLLKLDMSIGEDASYLFIMDEELIKRYIGEDAQSASFAPLDEWVTADISGFETYNAHGKSYGIDISSLDAFKEAGVNPSSGRKHYLFLRYYPRPDQLDEHKAAYESAARFANNMLEYKTK